MKRTKILMCINAAYACAFSAHYFLPRTLYLQSTKKKLEGKKDGVVIPVSKYLKDLINEVMDDMKMKPEEKQLIEPFMHEGLELIYFGYSGRKPGVILGIPQQFNIDYQIPVSFILEIDGKEAPPNSGDLVALKNSMTLSKEAKKFGIAHHIYESRHPSFYQIGLLPLAGVVIVFVALACFNSPNSAKSKKVISNLKVTFIVIGIIILLVTSDILNISKDGFADFEAAFLGEEYIKGGLEYYEKITERNKTLKKLHKKDYFSTARDAAKSMFEPRHMSISNKIACLKDLLKVLKTDTEKPSHWDYITLKELVFK